MKSLTIDEIRKEYPDQWVLIGNPVLKNPNLAPIVLQLLRGIVLVASTDKREVALKAHEARQGYTSTACIWTGEFPKNRRWLL
jgi:hypothetical protein